MGRIIPVGFKPLTFQFSLTCDGKNTRKDSVVIELSSLETILREEFGVWITEPQITREWRVCAGSTPTVPVCLDPCSQETGNL